MVKKRWLKFIFFALFIALNYTRATDADLVDEEIISENIFHSTTLDFSNKDTANAFSKQELFNINQIIPTGFAVESLRIQNEGETEFNYKMKFEKVGGESEFCNALDIKVLKNWSEEFNGDLNTFQWESNVPDNSVDDLVFAISFNDYDESLFSKSCQFNILVDAKALPSEAGGFFDQEILYNSVTSRN